MTRTLLGMAAALALTYVALCAALFVFQRSMIYLPQPLAPGTPPPALRLTTAEGDVLVSVHPNMGPKAVLYFGGNAEDVSLNLPSFKTLFADSALYLMHYRGYGGSAGSPSEAALVADALALFDRVHGDHAQVTVIGRSLGGGVAIQLASQRPVARLVLVTPFDSLAEVAASHYPVFPVRTLLRDSFESWRHAPQVRAPTTIIAAENDEVVPRANTERLAAQFAEGIATLVVLPATSHNTIERSPRYAALLAGLAIR